MKVSGKQTIANTILDRIILLLYGWNSRVSGCVTENPIWEIEKKKTKKLCRLHANSALFHRKTGGQFAAEYVVNLVRNQVVTLVRNGVVTLSGISN